jgi:hypothetical protein
MRRDRHEAFANASSTAFRLKAQVLRYASSVVTLCLYLAAGGVMMFSERSLMMMLRHAPEAGHVNLLRRSWRYKTCFEFATSADLLSVEECTVCNTRAHYVRIGVIILLLLSFIKRNVSCPAFLNRKNVK